MENNDENEIKNIEEEEKKELEEEYKKAFTGRGAGRISGGGISGEDIFRAAGFLLFIAGIILGFFMGLMFLVIALLGLVLIVIAPHIHMPETESIFVVLLILGLVAIGFVWFIKIGGGQAVLTGAGSRMGRGISAIFDSYAVKNFMNLVKNPFGISPTGGEFEEVQTTTKTPPPNQAIDVSIRGTLDKVLLDQPALTFIVTVENLGSSKISKVDVSLELLSPYTGCLKFEELGQNCDEKNGKIMCHVYDIPPFSSKEIVFSAGKLDGKCIADIAHGGKLIANTQIGNIQVVAKASTYYPTASRLAVERIKEDYGVLLIKNNVLRQKPTGAIYRAGTAVTIDMDIGDQPIFDSVKQAGLLMRWQNVGKGKIPSDKNPFLFIITPHDFGRCIPSTYRENMLIVRECTGDNCDGYSKTEVKSKCDTLSFAEGSSVCVLCDSALKEIWCSENSVIRKTLIPVYAPNAEEVFDWICDEILASNEYHVCATNSLTQEFNVFTCTLNLPGKIQTNENRVTNYITSVAVYPYTVQSAPITLKAYCVEGQGDWCVSKWFKWKQKQLS